MFLSSSHNHMSPTDAHPPIFDTLFHVTKENRPSQPYQTNRGYSSPNMSAQTRSRT